MDETNTDLKKILDDEFKSDAKGGIIIIWGSVVFECFSSMAVVVSAGVLDPVLECQLQYKGAQGEDQPQPEPRFRRHLPLLLLCHFTLYLGFQLYRYFFIGNMFLQFFSLR